MRLILYFLLALTGGSLCFQAYAQSNNVKKNDFLDSMLLSNEYAKQHKGSEATQDARNLLKNKQKRIDIEENRKLRDILKKQQESKTQTQSQTKEDVKRINQLAPAPFGLLWGETYEDAINGGVILTRTEEKDYVNSFIATQLPKPIKDIRYVVVTFGEDNKLWRMISYGNFIKDKPDASLILKEYRRFYDMLNKKYGNADEVFTPKIKTIKNIIDLGQGKTKEEIKKVEEPIGNPNFLSQLQSGEADLYASFYNSEVGAVLSVNVDGSGNSYLILEYKNLRLFSQQQNETLDAL